MLLEVVIITSEETWMYGNSEDSKASEIIMHQRKIRSDRYKGYISTKKELFSDKK